MKQKIRIIIADDKPQFRKLLCEILNFPNLEIVDQAENGEVLLEKLATTYVDIVLLDLEMPVMDGNKAFELIRNDFQHIKIIILSLHCEQILIDNYIQRGARGYFSKDGILGENLSLVDAINKIHYEDIVVFEKQKKTSSFTNRQVNIMPLIFEGLANSEIAEQVGVSTRAVEKQKRTIYKKSGSSKAVDFYKYAFTRGLQFLSRIILNKKVRKL